jgi:hypothetical protein
MNTTAPLNMTQINGFYGNEDTTTNLPICSPTDVVNSTQNLQKINSKESWKDTNQQP